MNIALPLSFKGTIQITFSMQQRVFCIDVL